MAQISQLTNREWEVVKLLLQGKSNKLIASSLGISDRTVEFHLKNIYAKHHVNSRVELILKLGNTTGKVEIEKLGYSTVDSMGKTAENRDKFDSRMNWTKSLISKRIKTMRTNVKIALRNALTGFAPGVFLFMAITALLDGIRFFIHNQNWEMFIDAYVRNQYFWEVFILELLLLTGGYALTTSVINPKYLNFSWWRSSIAGVGAVILLVLLSILTQGASLPRIVLTSLSVGMMSVLFIWQKTPQSIVN